jgi:hypothetical protein
MATFAEQMAAKYETLLAASAGLKIVHRQAEPVQKTAARAAAHLLAAGEAGWIDLRRGAIAPASEWGTLAPLLRSAAAYFKPSHRANSDS